ncbi:tRNA pseudouridine synthase B [Allostella humosa]|nr:tRNA pseudouridine(55) synthase TruB [Stella humosa]BBK33858.1 tRNA pseudouridine synthase B [Stella humosa]
MRRAEREAIHGWLVLDKPLGLTSTAAVGRVRRLTGAAKVGHGGTLDPLATGLLPIALGEATKTVGFAMTGAKTYRMRIAWGEERSTDDREGTVTRTSQVRPDAAAIAAALPAFIGQIMQVPPAFSAIKVAGQRSYDLARAHAAGEGEAPAPLAARLARIDAIRPLDPGASPDEAEFEVDCGKGVYMRSLARDLARALGTCGHVAALRRTRVGPFDLTQAISVGERKWLDGEIPLDKGGDLCDKAAIIAHLLPVATALDDIPALALTEAEAERLRHGGAVSPGSAEMIRRLATLGEGTVVAAFQGERLVALAEVGDGAIRPVRVMNL